MRHRTPKRSSDERAARKLEAAFLHDVAERNGGWLVCAIRGGYCLGNTGIVVDHIVGGPNRWKSILVRATFLNVCTVCNGSDGAAEDRLLWPIARKLAAKRIYDPQWFDLKAINRLLATPSRPDHERITIEMVEKYRDTIPQ